MHEARERGDHSCEVRLGAKEDGRAGAGGALFIFRPGLLGCGIRPAGGEWAVWACGAVWRAAGDGEAECGGPCEKRFRGNGVDKLGARRARALLAL